MKKLNRKSLKNITGELGIELNLPLPVGVCLGTLFLYALRIHIAEQMKDVIRMLRGLVSMGCVLQVIPAVTENVSDKIIEFKMPLSVFDKGIFILYYLRSIYNFTLIPITCKAFDVR